MAKEKRVKYDNEKPQKSFAKRFFITLLVIVNVIILAIGGVFAFGYFKYKINPIGLISSINKINKFDSSTMTLSNAFTEEDLTSANSKIDAHNFDENVIFFTDKEIAAKINSSLSGQDLGLDAKLLQLTFSNYDNYEDNIIVCLNFVFNLNTKSLKTESLSKFPASLLASNIPDELYLTISANLIQGSRGDTDYYADYVSIQINNLSTSSSENVFRAISLASSSLSAENISEKLANKFAESIIGNDNTEGVYTKLKSHGAKGYLFNKENENNCFSIFAHTVDEERTITYSNTKGLTNPNLTTYTLKNGVITLEPLELLGYNFLGWFDGSGNKVETIKTTKMLNYDLEARWSLVEYTITYVLKDGTVAAPGNPTSYTIESDTITLINPTPTKVGDSFIAWSGTIIDGETATAVIPKGTTGNLTFVAHYELDEVYLTLCVDGVDVYTQEFENGTLLSQAQVNHILAQEETGMVGYKVDSWFSNAAMTSPYTFGTAITRDFTLYGESTYMVSSPLTPENIARFGAALSTKTLTIQDHDDLVSWIFYVMFFDIKDNCKVKLYLPSNIAKNTTAISDELELAINDAYLSSTFQCGSTLAFSAHVSGPDAYGIVYVKNSIMGSFASQTFNSAGYIHKQQASAPASPFADTRADNYNSFNINKVGCTVEVSNSEQLVYALEMGFKPVCKPGSNAETVYNKAQAVLKNICNDQMTNTDKLFAIYTWLVMNAEYDHLAYNKSMNNEITAKDTRYYDSWFAEGIFNQGKAVCEGFAKAFLIMSKLENIPCVIVTGNNHAWNKVYVNGAWYGVDSTHGNSKAPTGNYEALTYTEFMFTDAYKTSEGYSSTDHAELNATTTFDFYDYFTISSGADLKFDSVSEISLMMTYIASTTTIPTGASYLTFECLLGSSVSVNNVKSQIAAKGLTFYNCYSTTNTAGKTVYIFYISL